MINVSLKLRRPYVKRGSFMIRRRLLCFDPRFFVNKGTQKQAQSGKPVCVWGCKARQRLFISFYRNLSSILYIEAH